MTHATEGTLQAYIDGELGGAEREALEEHLAGCDACADELAALRTASATLRAAVGALDRPVAAPPRLSTGAAAVGRDGVHPGIAGAGPNRGAAPRAASRGGRGAAAWRALPRAAVLVLGFAAAAAAAVPGSPVRGWIADLLENDGGDTLARQAEPVREAPVADPEPEAGVSVSPEAGAVEIALSDAAPGVSVTVELSDAPRAGVYAAGPAAATARFTTGPGRIGVEGLARGRLRIEIPRTAARATVDVGGRRYVAKDGAGLVLSVPEGTRGERVTFTVR